MVYHNHKAEVRFCGSCRLLIFKFSYLSFVSSISWPVSRLRHIFTSWQYSSVPAVHSSCLDEIDEMLILQSVFSQPCSIIHLGTFSSLYIPSSSPFVSLLSPTLSPSQSSAPLSQDLGHWFCDSDLFVCVCAGACCALCRDCVWLSGLKGRDEDDVERCPHREPWWWHPRCERRPNDFLSGGAVIKFSQSTDKRIVIWIVWMIMWPV